MKTALIVLAAIVVAGCTSKLQSDFTSGCRSTGGSKSYCSCLYDELEKELQAAEKNQNLLFGSKFKTEFVEAIQTCAKKQD